MPYYLLNEIEIAALQLNKRNTYSEMLKLMSNPPLHVIIKQLANTSWSKLDEELLRNIHKQLKEAPMKPKLFNVTIPAFIPTVSGKAKDVDVTYSYEHFGEEDTVVLDEVFCEGLNLTEFLSDEVLMRLEVEVEKLIEAGRSNV